MREQLQLAWFASIGELRNARTFYADGIAPGAELQSNLWRLLRGVRAEPGQTAQLWLVLRDDRGGLDWGTWTFEFEP